jgi:3-phosphoshikimate 1-carboxyvinyltransferase
MGGRFEYLDREGCLPIRVQGARLRPYSYRLPVASAQVKSSLLLAGLVAGVPVDLVEPGRSRNHTETMLGALGVDIETGPAPEGSGWAVRLPGPPGSIPPLDMEVPGDISSAAFFVVLGLLKGGTGPTIVRDVGLNPTRTGLLPVLQRMNARVQVENVRGQESGEPLGDLVVTPSDLHACRVGGDEIPSLIDEIPILAVGAARASGVTRITGAQELRVKETDRIRAVVENLRSVGAQAEELPDGMEIQGSEKPLRGRVKSHGDHRIAMAFGVLGALPGNQIAVDDPEVASVSFPGFWTSLAQVARGTPRPEAGP